MAGLLDGEGYFSHVDSGRIRCDMTDYATVRWIADTFGGVFNGPYLYPKAMRKPVWKWTLARLRDREVVLARLIPHLKLKKPKAVAMLALVEHSLYSRPVKNWNGHGQRPPEWERWRTRREQLREALKEAK